MPRYHFNMFHDKAIRDTEGMELADRDAAWQEATMATGEMIRSLDGKLRPNHEWRMEVTDQQGDVLWVIRVSAESHKG